MLILGLAAWVLAACSPRPGEMLRRRGDEIVIAGQYFHTGTPVVLWTDPGGYDAYRVEKRFVPLAEAPWDAAVKAGKAPESPSRYGLRRGVLTDEEAERVRGGGWDLPLLRRVVDQFVIHYDVCGTSRTCFRVLHDMRGLSVHFMLDLDGTIYQTLDVKERAWHAGTANDRSVGVEIANIGAYPPDKRGPLDEWYSKERPTVITIPPRLGDGGLRVPGQYRPARNEPVPGEIHGTPLVMYDLTPQQYASLARLAATLHRVLPGIRIDYPRDAEGRLLTRALSPDELASYTGLLGHYHVTAGKIDPGPAFDWDRVLRDARRR